MMLIRLLVVLAWLLERKHNCCHTWKRRGEAEITKIAAYVDIPADKSTVDADCNKRFA